MNPILLGRRVFDDAGDLADIHRHSHLPKSLRRDGDVDGMSGIGFTVHLKHDRFRAIFHEELLQLREIRHALAVEPDNPVARLEGRTRLVSG